MKKLLFLFLSLMMAGNLFADEYLYVDNFQIATNELGTTVTVPVKARFDRFINGFQVDFTMPEGLTIVDATAGSGMVVDYMNAFGEADVYEAKLYKNDDLTRFISCITAGGYWLVNGVWEMYGAVKWLGDYEEMFLIELAVAPNFTGGEITVKSQVSSGNDTRGEICRLQESYKVATVTVGEGSGGNDDPVADAYSFFMPDMNITSANTITIPVSMNNTSGVTAFQTDLYLPAGFEVAQDNGAYMVTLGERKAAGHEIMADIMPNGAIRVLCYSMSLELFSGNAGELFYITINIPEDADGTYEIRLKNTLLTNSADKEIAVDDTACELSINPIIQGDANGNGSITVTDIVVTAMFILNQNPSPFDYMAADMNGDGNVTVTDIVIIARMLFEPMNAPKRLPTLVDVKDSMSGNQIDIAPGETRTVSIMLDNEIDYSAFQFEMKLPEGLTASNFSMTDRAGDHLIDAESVGKDKVRVLAYSPTLQTIEGSNGAVLTFDVTATGAVDGSIKVNSVEMVTAMGQTVLLDKFSFQVNGTTSAKTITSATRIYSDGHNIIVESPADVTVTICDLMGRARNVNVTAGCTVIPVDNAGIYVVQAAGQTAKMSLR